MCASLFKPSLMFGLTRPHTLACYEQDHSLITVVMLKGLNSNPDRKKFYELWSLVVFSVSSFSFLVANLFFLDNSAGSALSRCSSRPSR
jgi:hypothetical protein